MVGNAARGSFSVSNPDSSRHSWGFPEAFLLQRKFHPPKFPFFHAQLCSHSQRSPSPHSKLFFAPSGSPKKREFPIPFPPQIPECPSHPASASKVFPGISKPGVGIAPGFSGCCSKLIPVAAPPHLGWERAGNDGRIPTWECFFQPWGVPGSASEESLGPEGLCGKNLGKIPDFPDSF